MSLLLGFPRRLVVARKPIFRLSTRNELREILMGTVSSDAEKAVLFSWTSIMK